MIKIAIIPTNSNAAVAEYVEAICVKLKELGCQPCVYSEVRNFLGDLSCKWHDDFFAMVAGCDACIGVGGDGTIIHAAKHAAEYGKPIFGVNCGRLGYLCALEPDELDQLESFVNGNYHILSRMMLDVSVLREDGSVRAQFKALNDAVMGNDSFAETIDVRVSRDATDVLRFRGDGVIFSTPTGSTAYALSAGGPIIDPKLNAVSVTPICPHGFSSKTTIFSCPTHLQARATSVKGKVYLTVDGEQCTPLQPDETLVVEKSDTAADFIVFKDLDFNQILNKKFNINHLGKN